MRDSERPDPAAGDGWQKRGPARKWIALALMAALFGLTWKTIDPGKIRMVVFLLLAVFAARIVLTSSR